MLNRWLDRIMNATKSEDAYIARDAVRNMFQEKDDRIKQLEAQNAILTNNIEAFEVDDKVLRKHIEQLEAENERISALYEKLVIEASEDVQATHKSWHVSHKELESRLQRVGELPRFGMRVSYPTMDDKPLTVVHHATPRGEWVQYAALQAELEGSDE